MFIFQAIELLIFFLCPKAKSTDNLRKNSYSIESYLNEFHKSVDVFILLLHSVALPSHVIHVPMLGSGCDGLPLRSCIDVLCKRLCDLNVTLVIHDLSGGLSTFFERNDCNVSVSSSEISDFSMVSECKAVAVMSNEHQKTWLNKVRERQLSIEDQLCVFNVLKDDVVLMFDEFVCTLPVSDVVCDQKLYLGSVPGDGYCLFHSIAVALQKDGKDT